MKETIKSNRKIIILILVVLILINSSLGTSIWYHYLSLLISFFAAIVIYTFYVEIHREFKSNEKLQYPIWILLFTYVIGGIIIFTDNIIFGNSLVNDPVLGLFAPVSFLSMFIGNIWLGTVLIKKPKLQVIGTGLIASLLAFSYFAFRYGLDSSLFIKIITQFINTIPYLLILRYYNSTENTNNNLG